MMASGAENASCLYIIAVLIGTAVLGGSIVVLETCSYSCEEDPWIGRIVVPGERELVPVIITGTSSGGKGPSVCCQEGPPFSISIPP